MTRKTTLIGIPALFLSALLLGACEQDDGMEEETEEAIEETQESISDTTEEAGDEIEETTD